MNYYSMEERETLYRYDPIDKRWYISSSHIPDIKKILERAQVVRQDRDESGRVIYVEAEAEPGQVRIYHDK